MGKWLSYGTKPVKDDGPKHDAPPIIRVLGLGPQEGAQWACGCGKVHVLVRVVKDGRESYYWDLLTDVANESGAKPKFDPKRQTMAQYLEQEWIDSTPADEFDGTAGSAIQFTLEWLAEHGQLRGPEVKQA
jgi:hypothetical protein